METLTEIERNLLALKWVQEDLGYHAEKAIQTILVLAPELNFTNPELALKLTQVYQGEDFWERALKASYENFIEI